MILALILLVAGVLLLFISLKKVFLDKGRNRNLPLWIGLAVLSSVMLVPGYFVWSIYDYSNPSKWHEIILPLEGHIKGDSSSVEFLLPKQKYIVLISFEELDDANKDEKIEVQYRVSIKEQGVVAEGVREINFDNVSYHTKSFEINNNRTEGEFFAEIISPSSSRTKVKVALSTDIFL